MVVQEEWRRTTIDLEEGWAFMQKGITKLKNILDGKPEPQFSNEDYMMLYTTIFNMCRQKPPHDYSQHLYDKYREAFEEYITSTVLPSLRAKHDELMLRELVLRWSNHKIMVRWLARFFHYLDRYFISRRSLTPLKEVGLNCFRELIYEEIKGQVKDAVIALINKEREGKQIDRALLKNVLDIFVEIGLGQMECYENDFEDFLLKGTTEYYSVKAQSWFTEYSCPRYMNKAGECLKREKERVGHYLHNSSEHKLLEKVQTELLARYEATLLKKVEDLSRTYQLSPVITNGLEPISASNKLWFSSDDHNMLDDHSKHLRDIILKSVLEKITPVVAPEKIMQRVCEGIMGSVVPVMFEPKDKSALEEHIKLVISKSASRDVKRKWEKILQKIQKERELCSYYTTGFVVGEDPTCVFILTCAHSVDECFNKYYPIEAKTIENLYKISVTCDHLEREHRRKKDSKPSNRVFVPAQVMEVDCRKDLLLIQVKKGICRENHEPLELAQNLPVPLERVGMVSWPPRLHGTESTGHMSHKERDYSDLDFFDDAYGYNFTALEVDIGCPDGSSGAPLVDLAGKVIGLLHGGDPRFNYFVSLKDIRAFLNHCGRWQQQQEKQEKAATAREWKEIA